MVDMNSSLTCTQMYVSGQLSDSDTVLVDVGTGYYIDMVRVFFC